MPLDAELPGDATAEPAPAVAAPASDRPAIGAEWQVLDRLDKTRIGRREPQGGASVRRHERPDCLLYGPFWQLHAGDYRLRFRCRASRPIMPAQPVLGVEIIGLDRFQRAWRDFTADEMVRGPQTVDFSVPLELSREAGEECRFEFRFFHLGNADLAIDAASLLRLDPAEAVLPPTRWRMLGRLRRQSIGRRRGDVVVVRRGERAGAVLFEAKPYLQLPQGRYRLRLLAIADRELMPSQPALAVEVLVQNRWRRPRARGWKALLPTRPATSTPIAGGDFTGAELAAGAAAIEFVVPAEPSLDRGDGARIQFRVLHLGNADLAIRALDLECLGPAADMPVPAPRWRLLGRLRRSRVGLRGRDRITLRRGERTRPVQPPLHLPEGRYELRFRCRTAAPASAEDSVLAVEIGAREPLRREFTGRELRDGEGRFEFSVASGDEPVQLAFAARGHAELDLEEVEFREIGGRDDIAVPRAAGRRTGRAGVVVVGNCQAQIVNIALCRSEVLTRYFDTNYHFVNLTSNLHELARRQLEKADFVLVQDIKDWEAYPLHADIPDRARIIKFPLLGFMSLWPFDHYNGMSDREAYDREWPNLTFIHLDGLLGRLRKQIPDPEQRFLAYRDLNLEGLINFHRLHDFESRRLRAMDRKFDIAIGDLVIDQFRHQRLFHTTVHPSGAIMSLLVRYLLKCLEVRADYRPPPDADGLAYLQVPVHPAVARALEVRWADASTLYRFGGERITWETYVRKYIAHYG